MTTPAGLEQDLALERVIATFDTGRAGAQFVVFGGIHGNEPGGIVAARRVHDTLERLMLPLRGRFVALAGNLSASAAGKRFLDRDLNRCWSRAAVAELRAQAPDEDDREQAEQRELLTHVDDCIRRGREGGGAVFLDLHSSSAEGAPFTCMADTLQNRGIAFMLPVPVILGLEETIDGAILDYVYEHGQVALAVEGGKHGEARTAEHLETAIWIGLVAAGCLDAGQVPELVERSRRLAQASRGIPRVLEVRHREELAPTDDFEMVEGFASFDSVTAGQLLAHKNDLEVRAPNDAVLLLPLYQGRGSDGFFLARRVRRFWLRLSTLLRRIGFARLLPLLPGVRRHPEDRRAFVVDPKVARLSPVGVFHLCGYRRCRREGDKLVFTSRREGGSARG